MSKVQLFETLCDDENPLRNYLIYLDDQCVGSYQQTPHKDGFVPVLKIKGKYLLKMSSYDLAAIKAHVQGVHPGMVEQNNNLHKCRKLNK